MITVVSSKGKYSAEERLMLAVLASNVKAYTKRFSCKKAKKHQAEIDINYRWIFEQDKASVGYVFSFEFICKWFGLDPNKMRKAIKKIKTPEQADEIFRIVRKTN